MRHNLSPLTSCTLLITGLLTISIVIPRTAGAQSTNQQSRSRTVSPRLITGIYHGTVGQETDLSASLLSPTKKPLVGRSVLFRVKWSHNASVKEPWQTVGSAETDEKGIAHVTLRIPADALEKCTQGIAVIQVSFAGDKTYDDENIRYNPFLIGSVALRLSKPMSESGGDTPLPADTGNEAPKGDTGSTSGSNTNPPKSDKSGSDTSAGSKDDLPPVVNADVPDSAGNLPLAEEMRKILGAQASTALPNIVPEEYSISADAVGLVKEQFDAVFPRWWLDVFLVKIEKKKGSVIIPIPGMEKTKIELVFVLTDAYSGAKYQQPIADEKQGWSFPIKLDLGKTGAELNEMLSTGIDIKRLSQLGKQTGESAQREIFLNKVLGSSDSGTVRSALKKGTEWACEWIAKESWATRVISIRPGGKTVLLSGGPGCGLTKGQKLSLVRLESIKEGKGKGVYTVEKEPVGELEIVAVREKSVLARVVNTLDGQSIQVDDVVVKSL